MNRYLLKFEKSGQLRYTSHLDLARIFKRNFKKAGIDLEHSKGFNPHPKMSFAQPLSLGYESRGEYLEIETQRPYAPEMIIGLVNCHLPYGVKITTCVPIEDLDGKLAALVEFGEYMVRLDPEIKFSKENIIDDFLNQEQILISKWLKKKNQEVSVDIKALIDKLSIKEEGDNTLVYMTLHTGSKGNLNPEALMDALFKYDNLNVSKGDYRITRLDLLKKDKKPFL